MDNDQWVEWAPKALKNMSDAVITADNKGCITLANPAASKLLDKPIAELIGKSLRQNIELVDMHSRNSIQLPTQRVFRKNFSPRIFAQADLVSDNGRNIPVEAILSPVRGFRGSVAGEVFVLRDRSKQVASDQFFLMNNKIEALGSLAGSIARAFNNWIGLITSKASSIADNLTPRTQAHNDAIAILETSKKANALSRRLLSIANASDRRLPEELDTVSLRKALNETLTIIKPEFDKRGIEIDIKNLERFPFVKAEGAQLTDCLVNILLNAAEAMPDSGGKVIVDAAEKKLDHTEYCVLRIRDNGNGMPSEVLQRAFEPFFTTKDTNRSTGLGLTIVQGSIQAWNGHVKIRSRTGQGTSVRLFIQKGKPETEVDQNSGRPTAFIADDKEDILTLATDTLENMGYRIMSAASGRESIETVRKHKGEIDLFLIDVFMPEKNGKDVLEAIFAADPTAKVIMMSGFSKDYVRAYLSRGVWGYLQKPFDEEKLSNAIYRIKPEKNQ